MHSVSEVQEQRKLHSVQDVRSIKAFFCPHFLLEWLEAKRHVTNLCTEHMGKGGKKSGGQSPWSWTGKTGKAKGTTRPGTAIGLPSHYGLDVLRPYHGEDGSIFVKRSGATRDADLLSPDGLAQRLNAGNSELLNRPGKGITMLAGTIFHGLSAVRFSEEHPDRNGLGQLEVSDEVVAAAKRLQEAQHTVTSPEEIRAAVLTVLQYIADPDSVESWRRATILGAHLYATGQQVLQVPWTRLSMCKQFQTPHEKFLYR